MCAKLKRAKRKSGGFGVKRLTDKWRNQTYSVKLFYHVLDNYFTENERLKNLRRMALPSDRNLRKSSTTQREAASITKKDSKVSFHSLCDFVYGCHSDRMKVCGRWFFFLSSFWIKAPLKRLVGVSFWDPPFPCRRHVYKWKLSLSELYSNAQAQQGKRCPRQPGCQLEQIFALMGNKCDMDNINKKLLW